MRVQDCAGAFEGPGGSQGGEDSTLVGHVCVAFKHSMLNLNFSPLARSENQKTVETHLIEIKYCEDTRSEQQLKRPMLNMVILHAVLQETMFLMLFS